MWDTDLQHAIQLVSSTNTREPSEQQKLCDSNFRNFTASVNYVPAVPRANYGQQYFIQVVVDRIGYCTYCYH